MNSEDIKEIVRTQLLDIGILADDIYFNIAINYYQEHNSVPDINYIIGMMLEGNDNNYYSSTQSNTEHIGTNILPEDNILQNLNIMANSDAENRDNDEDEENDIDDSSEENNINNNNDESEETNDNLESNSVDLQNITEPQMENVYSNNLSGYGAPIYQVTELLRIRDAMNLLPNENVQIQTISENTNALDVKKVIKNIDNIPLCMFKNLSNPNGNKECHICFDQFVPTDIIRVLPCSHNLHRYCIDEQLKKISHLCPYCKAPAGEYIYYNL
jgi:hypothetical protein